MTPAVLMPQVAPYLFSVFGIGAYWRSAKAIRAPNGESARHIRRRTVLIGMIALATFGLWLEDPTFQTWKQFGYLWSTVCNFAVLSVMVIMLKRIKTPDSKVEHTTS